MAALSIGALGVVYGDIGTSPLYAMRECLAWGHAPNAVEPTTAAVLGVTSLMLWALILVVVIKYLVFVVRADNKGEGGILALSALLDGGAGPRAAKLAVPLVLALFGAGLLFGDGVITPAISVLGAMDGLGEQSASLEPFIVPAAIGILVALFLAQRHGTGRIGGVFGWIVLVWFLAIGVAGVRWIVVEPSILRALSPHYAAMFLVERGWPGFLLLGSVVLVVTGGEALYADMGHFGRTPIRLAWFIVAFPGLVLNYLGQGALFLARPVGSISNPFYAMVDGPLLVPMIVLATMAAIIASQALISGVFSLTRQAMQLGFWPRVTVTHTSEKNEGQVYVPEMNYMLLAACIILVLGFRSSSALASAYGIAVTGTMAITSYLFYLVSRRVWHHSQRRALALLVPMLIVDFAFLVANATKFADGGWFPLAVGLAVFAVMTTWWRGRIELARAMEAGNLAEDLFLADIIAQPLHRVRGTAVFMASTTDGIPNVLLHHIKHNQVLHKQVVLFSVRTESAAWVTGNKALTVSDLGNGFYRVVARCGFMQSPDVPRLLARCVPLGLTIDEARTTYYLGRQTLLTGGRSPFARWRKLLFSFLARNARPPTAFFNLPPNRVVEMGVQVEL
ncbi:MAG: potassium transporter Kup [Kofleriaceae bacterium]|nr:potassium transporter Kup [Myxococcales bacterium]MCB9571014.1 potassium transporter Kup [Kofleriaceae bacterium]